MKSEQIKFMHFRRPLVKVLPYGLVVERLGATGGVTVAYQKIGPTEYLVGFARCRVNEHYNKRTGRTVAYENMMKDPVLLVQPAWFEDSEYLKRELLDLALKSSVRKNLRPTVRRNGNETAHP